MNDNSRVQLSHDRVENEIGRGGMVGVVYRVATRRPRPHEPRLSSTVHVSVPH